MNDWIDWPHGSRPCPIETYVEIRRADGGTYRAPAGSIDWAKTGRSSDVVAYRVVSDLQKAQQLADRLTRDNQLLRDTPLDVQVGGNHYKDMAIQPVEFIHANGIGYFEGNVIKYVTRWRKKNGVADLEKARHYIDLLIDLERRHGRQ